MKSDFTVLLYYKYVDIDDPDRFAGEHLEFCRTLDLKGRIIVAAEGINGTVGGTEAATEEYKRWAANHPLFHDMDFKAGESRVPPFKRLSVKARREIVTLGLERDLDPRTQGAPHLSPAEWKQAIEEEGVVLFDVRNAYESGVGRFKGAIAPPIDHFRELPEALGRYGHLKEKKVLLYCTGGIRCEKASALFCEKGFRDVSQLAGGILNYAREFGDEHWEGDCFVFDERVMVGIGDSMKKPPAGRCAHTGRPTRNVINCLHDPCHRLFLASETAIAEDPSHHLCPACLASGLTAETAGHKGSPPA